MPLKETVNEINLLSAKEMDDCITQLAKKIIADNGEDAGVVLIGIKTRGVPLAAWLARKIGELRKTPIEVGSLDINLYRDDLSEVSDLPVVKAPVLSFPITGKGVILVDDVLYTGRTIRAALDALSDFGRPRFVRLAVMVDRGFRQLPIQADYVARKIETTAEQNVKVMLAEIDGVNQVIVRG